LFKKEVLSLKRQENILQKNNLQEDSDIKILIIFAPLLKTIPPAETESLFIQDNVLILILQTYS